MLNEIPLKLMGENSGLAKWTQKLADRFFVLLRGLVGCRLLGASMKDVLTR